MGDEEGGSREQHSFISGVFGFGFELWALRSWEGDVLESEVFLGVCLSYELTLGMEVEDTRIVQSKNGLLTRDDGTGEA